jgi:DNA-binding transcriptional ArsR family regulator
LFPGKIIKELIQANYEAGNFVVLKSYQNNYFIKENINRNIAIDMGLTKTEIFSTEQNHLAQMLKALAHPARIAILQEIMKANTCICGELVNELGLAQATISQHLKELKNAGLIQGTVEGASVCYCINPETWSLLEKEIVSFISALKTTKNCC